MGVARLVNTMGVTEMRWHRRRGYVQVGVLGNISNYSIMSRGCPQCISMGGSRTGSIKYDGIQIKRLGVDENKLLCFEDNFLLSLWALRCNILGDRGK